MDTKEEQFSEGGKSIADLVRQLDKTGTGNQMTPDEVADHVDEEKQGKDTIRFTDPEVYVKELKKAFAELDDDTKGMAEG